MDNIVGEVTQAYAMREKITYAGAWELPGSTTYFACIKKPRWLTRFLMKHLVEWKWKDSKELGGL